MAKSYLGVKIDQNRLNIVEVNNHNVQRYVYAEIPEGMIENDSIISYSGIEDLLVQVLKENKIRTKKVCFVLQESDVLIKKMSMPAVTERQLEMNLPYEFKDYITEDKDQYIYDYAITKINKEDDKVVSLELIGAAVLASTMDAYKRMFRNAGLKLVQAMPQELAIANALDVYYPQFEQSDAAILALNHNTSTIYLYHNGIFDTNRTMDAGFAALSQRAAQILDRDVHVAQSYVLQNVDNIQNHPDLQDTYGNIAVDVMRSINYYTYENRDNTLDTLYVTGEGSQILPLIQTLAETISLRVVQIDNLVSQSEEKQALTFALSALGSCWNEEEK